MDNNSNEEIIYTCPECGNQVFIDDDHCSKCGVELSFDDDELIIIIRTFSKEFDAQLAKSMLDDEGIECFISKDDEGSMAPYLQSTNGVDLHIFEKDKEKANEVLKTMNE